MRPDGRGDQMDELNIEPVMRVRGGQGVVNESS